MTRVLVSILTLSFWCSSAHAHHAFAMHFDSSNTLELKGVVTEFRMRSPHAFLFVDVTDDSGAVQNWEVELPSAVHLRRRGIEADSIEPGDGITVTAWANRDPDKTFVFARRYVSDTGKSFGQRPAASEIKSQATEGVAAISGRWSTPPPHENPQKRMPLNEAGELAVANYDAQLSPATTCEPPTIPDLQLSPYLTDIRIRDEDVIFFHEVYGVTRTIRFDSEATMVEPTGYMGVASARIEGDELVIESRDYPASRWGLAAAAQPKGGPYDVPSSTQKKIQERYSVSDDGQTLTLQYTLEDPAYLTEVYVSQMTMNRVSDDEPMFAYECEVDAAKRFSE